MSGAYIGPLGSLIEIAHYKGSVSTTANRDVAFKRTLGGGNRAFVSPNVGLREWSVDAPMLSPAQYGPFDALLASGHPPWVWVDPLAQHTNVLSHRKSLPGAENPAAYVGGSPGMGNIPGIGLVPAVLGDANQLVNTALNAPVIPGKPVTASVWVQGSASGSVTLDFLTSAGVSTQAVAKNVTFGQWARVSVTGTPTAGHATVRLLVRSTATFYVALPAVTWTPVMTEWSVGRGSSSVVVHGYSDNIVLASERQQIKDLSFTVTEVGTGA